VLDGGTLDTLPYAPEAGPFAAAVLDDAYGVPFFTPPEAGRHLGQLARSFGRETWERFTVDDWRRLAAKHGITAVVAYRDGPSRYRARRRPACSRCTRSPSSESPAEA
jgi:hypothetical protein